MAFLLAAFLVLHGLIHLLGFAKAFRLATLPQLTTPISPVLGVLWFASALGFILAAAALFAWPRVWWAIGACAIAISTVAIASSWTDAKFGAAANVVALVAVVFGFLAQGPTSLRARYDQDVERGLARLKPTPPITDADLAHLPSPVQRYLRGVGVVGQPRVQNIRARMHGRIRSGPNARWMPLTAEQYNFFDEPSRLFYMNASMFLMPIQGYHRYVGQAASMLVKVAALVPVADASGPEATQAETVTMFNDMCLLAPATLVDPSIAWEAVDARNARASLTNAGHTIHAELQFNEAGELANFVSDDRGQASPDGKPMRQVRWSTPVSGYRTFGPFHLFARGQARWQEAGGDYAYIELELDDIQFNVARR